MSSFLTKAKHVIMDSIKWILKEFHFCQKHSNKGGCETSCSLVNNASPVRAYIVKGFSFMSNHLDKASGNHQTHCFQRGKRKTPWLLHTFDLETKPLYKSTLDLTPRGAFGIRKSSGFVWKKNLQDDKDFKKCKNLHLTWITLKYSTIGTVCLQLHCLTWNKLLLKNLPQTNHCDFSKC